MLVQARFFSCQPTLPSDPQSGSQSRPPMPLRMKETRVYWWIRSECYHNFTRLPKCCPLGYPGDSPHTVSSHSEAFINKAKFIITQRICFCFTLEKNKLFSHRTCCPLRPSPFLRPLWLQPHCLCLLSLWGWTSLIPLCGAAVQQNCSGKDRARHPASLADAGRFIHFTTFTSSEPVCV